MTGLQVAAHLARLFSYRHGRSFRHGRFPRRPLPDHPGRGAARGIVVLLSAFGLVACGSEGPTRPDLVLITVDGLAADRLGCFGGAAEEGRSVCALGEHGTLFAWSVSTGVGEASAAATLLTGSTARVHGVADDGRSFLASRHITVAEELALAGYRTAAFVTSPRLNRSRRLDQGFELYDDALTVETSPEAPMEAASIALSARVQDWIRANPAPRFVWIHAGRAQGAGELDRLLSRLAQLLDHGAQRPGVLFAALRGEQDGQNDRIGWRSHRIPLIWRPPEAAGVNLPRVSRSLAGLSDIAGTLSAAARLSGSEAEPAEDPTARRVDLTRLASENDQAEPAEERFLLLQTPAPKGEVGLASPTHLYVRRRSILDGSGRPVPISELSAHDARFSALPIFDRLRHPAPRSADLEPGPWRSDVLDASSPVPRLEFHLARRLGPARPSEDEETR